MKTNLLKKVKKRFEIVRIDELPKSPNYFITLAAERWQFPFYQIIDKKESIGFNNLYCSDINKAFEEIIYIVRKEYKNKQKQKNIKIWPL